jgi:hypothetical protein
MIVATFCPVAASLRGPCLSRRPPVATRIIWRSYDECDCISPALGGEPGRKGTHQIRTFVEPVKIRLPSAFEVAQRTLPAR